MASRKKIITPKPNNMRYCLLFILLCCYSNLITAQATRPVRGTVTDSVTGQPMSGVIITNLRGQRFATDYRGYFVVQLPMQNDTLRFNYLGYTIRRLPIPINQQEALIIILAPRADKLEDVVVNTGYQQLPKERATGSFSQVSKALLEEQVSTDLVSRLEGTANSFLIDRKTSTQGDRISIRGLSTIGGPRMPLIILDNFPYEGDLNNINPNDIETVTLLKDAAAASIWGAKAGNGVLVITTKKARYEQPIRVDFNMNITSIAKPDLFALPFMSTSDYVDVEQLLYNVGYYNSRINSTTRSPLTPVMEVMWRKANGLISASEADAQINAMRNLDVRNDIMKWLCGPAVKQQYSLSVRGGNKQQAWIMSAGLDKNINTLGETYQRVNLRTDQTIRLGKTTVQTGFYFTESLSNNGRTDINNIRSPKLYLYPYAQLADESGSPMPISRLRQGYIDTAGAGRLLNWDYYPLEDMNHIKQSSRLQDIVLTTGIQRPLLKGLLAELRYQYEKQFIDTRNLQDEDSYFARDMVNRFSQVNYATGAVTYKVPKGGVLDYSRIETNSQALRGQLNYQHRWGNQELVTLVGGEYRLVDNSNVGDRIYGYDESTLRQGIVDYTNTYPNFITKSNQSIPRNSTRNGTASRYLSFFGNAAYTYQKKYTITASIRKDASNLFGLNINDKWSPLYSIGTAWQLSQESFYKINWLPQLKLRVTYGKSGNTDASRSAVTSINYLSTSPYTQLSYASIGQPANPSLRWEKVSTINIGMDFASQDQRLSGSLEYYEKRGIDLFGTAPIDYTSAPSNSLIRNSANIITKGWDLELQTVNITGVVKWTSNLNLSLNRDKVLQYFASSKLANRYIHGSSSIFLNALEGYPVYGVFAYKWLGLDPQTGNPIGVLNGQPSTNYAGIVANTPVADAEFMGTLFPKVLGSFRNNLQWKQLSLSFNLLFKFDYYFKKSPINYYSLMDLGYYHADYSKRWQKPGDEAFTSVPSFVYPTTSARDEVYEGSATHVRRGDHVRLQYVNLSYDFTKKQLKKIGWQQVQIYLNIQNLGIIWRANKEGIDPEYLDRGAVASIGSLPPTRSISMGLRVQF